LSIYKKSVLVLIISGFLFAGIIFIPDIEPLDYVRTHFFYVPDSMKFIFNFSIFLILFFVLFLIFNFKPYSVITEKVSKIFVSETEFPDETEEFEETSFFEIEETEEDEEITDIDEIEEINEEEEIEIISVSETEKINFSKSLLKAAGEILAKIKKEEIKTSASVRIRKGLFKRASECLKSTETTSVPASAGEGLLKRANELLKSAESKKAAETNLAAEIETGKPSSRGLLALASTYNRQEKPDMVLSTDNYYGIDDSGQELFFEMEAVSSFSSTDGEKES